MRKASKKVETCCIRESVESTDIYSNQAYSQTFALDMFYRASQIAPNFKFYRAKSVKWEYQPYYNTFQAQSSGASVAAPYLYMTMNRTQDAAWQTTQVPKLAIQAMGAKARKLMNTVVQKYVPNWCSPGLTAVGINSSNLAVNAVWSNGVKIQKGWISCPNTNAYSVADQTQTISNPALSYPSGSAGLVNNIPVVVYNGHSLYIDQDNNPPAPICRVVITVEWEFKGPNLIINLRDPQPPVEELTPDVPTEGLASGA